MSWRAGEAPPAADKRASLKATASSDGSQKVRGEGDLAGGGAWLETDMMGGTVTSWLTLGDTTVECMSQGDAAVLAACKSLRPR